MLLLYLKTALRDLLLPPSGLLLLGFLALLLPARRARAGRLMLWLALGALWLLATPLIADTIARLAQRAAPLDWRQLAGAQAIVILGGGGHRDFAPEYGGPAADPELLQRLAYGAWIARRSRLPILVSGFEREAADMSAALRQVLGITARWSDDRAYDTFQNAHFSALVLGPEGIRRIALVTSALHMQRATREFEAAGFEVVPAPVGIVTSHRLSFRDFVPRADALQRSYEAVYELLGRPVRRALAATRLRRQ